MNADVKKIVQTAKKIYAKVVELIKSAFNTWPKAFIAVVAALIIGYYPLGGRLSERIDKTEDYDFSSISEKQLQSIESIAFLIDREVNQHIWTPNLPFFFPAYSLDNMPNFQVKQKNIFVLFFSLYTNFLFAYRNIICNFGMMFNCYSLRQTFFYEPISIQPTFFVYLEHRQ